jgi:cytidyltransferase-like protein
MSKSVIVLGAFDDLRSRDVRMLEEASRLGPVTVVLLSDEAIREKTGSNPKFPFAERQYLVRALRFVAGVTAFDGADSPDAVPELSKIAASAWVDVEGLFNSPRREFCDRNGLDYHVLSSQQLTGFPTPRPSELSSRKKVVVTGCYDWLHSGHVRFFEEVSGYGELHVVVGHDANIRLLKGDGHPLLLQEERRYMAGTIRYVAQAHISSGEGWLDADPEIKKIRPDFYAVNEDGDRGGKREYCSRMGIEYLVLKRIPAAGLPSRSSSDLRGF